MDEELRLKSGVNRRRLFGPEDDKTLNDIVTNHEWKGWKAVAKLLPGFTPKQLRDRWHNYLSPKNKFSPWTPEEDQILIDKVRELGTKWSTIASFLEGRSDNCVKNRWNSVLKTLNQQKAKKENVVLPPITTFFSPDEIQQKPKQMVQYLPPNTGCKTTVTIRLQPLRVSPNLVPISNTKKVSPNDICSLLC